MLELDANAKAVEILMRAKDMSRREAVGTIITHLRAAERAVERGGPITSGHRAPPQKSRTCSRAILTANDQEAK
ncbi:MAG: hypothetical protein DMD96_13460 [Candidatus Rokuibacteriota bacterium]|nr:MAG: hypothetical protein DMD96_13460 [Candidatus Rokubacteria bacterium]